MQPHLLVLNETVGDWEKGTVVLAVNAVDKTSSNIEVYVSSDSGESWEHAGVVASGAAPNTTDGSGISATGVSAPFLLVK